MRPLPPRPFSSPSPVGLSCRSAFLLAWALFLDLVAVDARRLTCLARKIRLSSRRLLPGYGWHGSSVNGLTWALALAAGLTSACLAASKPQLTTNAAPLVWPPPPAEPRLTYLQSLSGPVDFGARPSGWNRLSNLVSGGDRGKEKLIKPFGIALDESDNLCVTDMGTGRVWFFDRSHKRVRSWDKVGKLAFIAPVAVAKIKNRLFVADSAMQQVIAFDSQGKFLFAVGQPATRPTGLAISGEKLLVADSAGHRIVSFSLNGEYLSQFGQRGEGPGELNFPTHVTVNARGHILVTDSMNSRIQEFDSAGRFLRLIGSAGDGSGYFSRPKGIAVDQAGHVYVVDALFDNFQIFDPEGKFLLAVGMPGSAPGQFWMPAGIAISRDQQIFIADGYNGRIQVFQYLRKP